MVEILFNPLEAHQVEKLRFYTFQHPYVCKFVEALSEPEGIRSLLSLTSQSFSKDKSGIIPPNYFLEIYTPSSLVDEREYPHYDVDFRNGGAYAQYNWELFFHVPLFIATRLMQDQRHEEAMRWFHYIFNPMTDDETAIPQRYWNFKPFRDEGVPERIQDLLLKLQTGTPTEIAEIEEQIREWHEHPFQPHRIARGRPGAYMKTVVMKYIDNLIAWGDKLFSRDTIESINEATQLYILAANLLGARPQRVPPVVKEKGAPPTYNSLRKTLDAFSNGIVQVENLIPFSSSGGNGASNDSEGLYGLANLAFCIPHNEKLIGYWDTVEDRLFKIRHCMNIEGVVRQLPLFEPPIDPALLVRATAMGLDLSQVLDDLSAPLPHYRFTFMLQKAREFCEELKQLGNLLLSALEKKDSEKLAQVRATHEKDLLKAVLEVKKKQVKETEETIAGLEKAREIAETRKQHYEAISNRLPEEKQFLDKQAEALAWKIASQMAAFVGSSVAAPVPEVTAANRAVAPGVDTKLVSGQKMAAIANLVSTYIGWLGEIASLEGTTADYKGGLIRAQQDRDLQIKLATHEIQQIDKQIVAADIRRQIAENELANHEKQIEQSTQVEEFLREKFTNQDLYNWMVSQVAAVYFQVYKLAYDLAKRAERVYRHELGITDSGFIRFGAWDSLHKGLLAGEKLSLDLRRLEHAYLEGNKREHEVTKHVSLALLAPGALLKLRETGTCEFRMPELLFDLDFPGHYDRLIKSVRLTVPCVIGPYTGVNAKLTLLKNRVRKTTAEAKKSEEYPYKADSNGDNRFLENLVGIQSITTSSAQNDSGLFELNFRDERFLPFEGAGVISTWRLELPTAYRHFDYDTISDVVLHISYTARDGGDAFKAVVAQYIQEKINEWFHDVVANETYLPRLFSLRHDFPNAFHRLLNPSPGSDQFTEIEITEQHFPYFISDQAHKLKLFSSDGSTNLAVYLKPTGKHPINTGLTMTVKVNGSESAVGGNTGKNWVECYTNFPLREGAFSLSNSNPIGTWTIEVGSPGLDKDQLEDILFLLKYTVGT